MTKKIGTIVLPTGTGKTLVGVGLLKRLISTYGVDGVDYVVITPTIGLAMQWSRELTRYNIPNSLLTQSFIRKRRKRSTRIMRNSVMTYPLFRNMVKSGKHEGPVYSSISFKTGERIQVHKVLIMDEAHHAHSVTALQEPTKIGQAVLKYPAEYKIGLSATPVEGMVLPVIYQRTYNQLRDYIPPIHFYNVITNLTPKDQLTYLRVSRSMSKILESMQECEDKTCVEAHRTVFHNYVATRLSVMSNDPNIIDTTVKIMKYVDFPAIIFTQRLMAVSNLANEIYSKGTVPGREQQSVIPVLDEGTLREVMQGNWKVVIAAKRISEGIDIPQVNSVVLSSYPSSSRTVLIQMVGRVLRNVPGKVAKIFLVNPRGTYGEKVMKFLMDFLGERVEQYNVLDFSSPAP